MFNKFFKGSVDDLLAQMQTAPISEINKIGRDDEVLNREEMIAMVMDDFKKSREEAERIVTEIQEQEFYRIANNLVEKGLLEIKGYDGDGNPEYGIVGDNSEDTSCLGGS